MSSLSGSPFLQSLGWAIAGSLWQMALLWVVYQLCFLAWKNAKATVKTAAATALLFTGFGWFLSSLIRHYWELKTATLASGGAETSLSFRFINRGHAVIDYVNGGLAWAEHYLPYLSSAYLLVLAFLLIRVGKAYRQVQTVRYEGLSKIDPYWRVYVTELAYRIGIRRDVRVWLSEKIDIPATVGYLKPLILLPIASFNQLTTEQVEAILLHELAHIKRHDYLLNLVITVVDTILFFNPFAQLLTRHIRKERENSCDDFVLQFRYNPHSYASALLSLERQRASLELAMAASGKTDLLDRIKRILNVPASKKPMNYGQKLMALLITAGIMGSLAWLTPQNAARKAPSEITAFVPPAAEVREDDAMPSGGMAEADAPPPIEAPAPRRFAPTAPPIPSEPKKRLGCPDPAPREGMTEAVRGSDSTYSVLYLNGLGLDTFKFKMAFKMDTMKFRLGALSQLYTKQYVALFNAQRENLRRSETAMRELQRQAEGMVVRQREESSLQAEHQKELAQKLYLLQQQDLRQALRLQDQCKTFQTYTVKAARFKVNTRAQVLDQMAADDVDNGISADQPGWQSPVNTYYYKAPRWTATPVAFVKSTRNLDNQVELYGETAAPYLERFTILKSKGVIGQDKRVKASAIVFLKKLEEDGNLPEGQSVRIVRGDRVLVVNGKKLPDEDYNRYNVYMEGKNFTIISTGKAVQVTIR